MVAFNGAYIHVADEAIQKLSGEKAFGTFRTIRRMLLNIKRGNNPLQGLSEDVVQLSNANKIKLDDSVANGEVTPGFIRRTVEYCRYFCNWVRNKFSRTATAAAETAAATASKLGKVGDEITNSTRFYTGLFGRKVDDIIEIPGTDKSLKILSKSDDGKTVTFALQQKTGDKIKDLGKTVVTKLDDGATQVVDETDKLTTIYHPVVPGHPLKKTIIQPDGHRFELESQVNNTFGSNQTQVRYTTAEGRTIAEYSTVFHSEAGTGCITQAFHDKGLKIAETYGSRTGNETLQDTLLRAQHTLSDGPTYVLQRQPDGTFVRQVKTGTGDAAQTTSLSEEEYNNALKAIITDDLSKLMTKMKSFVL